MVKSKNIKEPKVDKEVFTYASKEEEDEFLNFSDNDSDDNDQSSAEEENTNKASRKKAFEVDMSDAEMVSDDEASNSLDEEIEDENSMDEDLDVADDISDEEGTYDRKSSRELAKTYAEQNKRTVFVGNITPKVTKKVLIQLFNSEKAAGPEAVESVRIRGAITQDESNNRHAKRRAIIQHKFKNEDNQVLCAYVVLKKQEDVEKCLKLNNYKVDGKHIRVDIIRGKKMSYESNNCIFIGNLPFDCDEEQVREAFSKCGEVVSVRLVRSKADGKIQGFGYVGFSESMGVDFSLKMNNTITVGDRKIRIEKWSEKKTQKQKRKLPANEKAKKSSPTKKKKVVIPTNMRSLELNEFIKSKQKKMNKKKQKKITFIKEKKKKSTQ